MRILLIGLLGLAACAGRHGDPLGPDWLPQPAQASWGRAWHLSPAGPISVRTLDHIADQIVGIERFRGCLRASRSASVVLTYRWTIQRDGSPAGVTLAGSTEREPTLESCLARALSGTRFVPASAETAAEWTFVHRAKQGELVIPPAGQEPPEPGPARPVLANEWFRACYDAGRAQDPGLNGHIGFRFLIDPSGKVSAVRDEGSKMTDLEVVDCSAELIYAQGFGANAGYRIAVRTIEFRPSAPYVITK